MRDIPQSRRTDPDGTHLLSVRSGSWNRLLVRLFIIYYFFFFLPISLINTPFLPLDNYFDYHSNITFIPHVSLFPVMIQMWFKGSRSPQAWRGGRSSGKEKLLVECAPILRWRKNYLCSWGNLFIRNLLIVISIYSQTSIFEAPEVRQVTQHGNFLICCDGCETWSLLFFLSLSLPSPSLCN